MAKKKIGAIIALDGEKDFRQNVTNVNKSLTSMKSELSLVKAECEGQASTLTSLSKKHEILVKILAEHKKKEEEIAKGLIHAKESYSSVGTGLAFLNKRYKEQEKQLSDLKQAYEDATARQKKMKEAGNASEDSMKKQEAVVKSLGKAIKENEKALKETDRTIQKGERNLQSAINKVADWETKLNTAKSQTIRANKEINKNAAYMREAQNATDKCAKSIDAFGKETKQAIDSTLSWKEALKGGVAAKAIDVGADAIKTAGDAVLKGTTDLDKASHQMEASTNLSTDALTKYHKVMKEVYAGNFGDNFEDVANTISEITHAMGELGEQDLKNITEGAITLRDTFNMDVNETIRGTQNIMEHFNLSAMDAFDMVAQGAREGLNYTNELGDNLAEYSGKFSEAGYSASEYFQLLKNGSENGAYNLDKVNDAINEVTIRLGDGTIEKNLSAYSEETQKLFLQWESGGATQKQVIDSIVNDIKSCTNQQDALNMAAQAFGTMAEDGGLKFISALSSVGNSFENVKGSMESIKEIRYDDLNSQITEIGRSIQMKLADQFEGLLPIAKTVLGTIDEHLVETEILVGSLGTALMFYKIKKSDKLSFLVNEFGRLKTSLSGAETAAGMATKTFRTLKTFLSANPVTAAAGAILLAVGALELYKTETDQLIDKLDEEATKRKTVDSAIQSNIRSRKEEISNTESEWASMEMLGDKLISLNKIENKTPEQILQMKVMVEELSGSIPELSSAFDEETGSIQMNEAELKKLISTSKEYALAKAAQSNLIQIGKDMFKNEQNLIKAQNEREKLVNRLNKAQEEASTYQGINSGAMGDVYQLSDELRELDKEIAGYEKTQKKLGNQYDTTAESAEKYAEATQNIGTSTEEAAVSTEGATQQIATSYRTMQEAIKNAMENTGNIFEKYETEDISTDTLLNNMESQVKAFENWQKNLRKLSKKAGKGMNEELFDQLAEMGPEGAAYVEAFASMSDKELKKASEYFERRTSNIVEDAEKNSKKASKKWEKEMEGIGDSSEKAGKDSYHEISDAFTKLSSRIEKSGGSIASSTTKAFKKAVANAKKAGVDIPEGLAEGIISGKIKPEAAIKKINSAIQSAGKDLIKEAEKMGIEVPNHISNGITSGGMSAVQAIADLNNLIAKKQQETKKTSKESGKESSKETGSGMKDGQSYVTGAAGSVATAGVNTTKSYYTSFKSAGKNLSLGIAEGIRAGESSVVNAARDVVRAGKTGANKEADSHSPSRVFRDQVGLMMSLGMAEGIRKGKRDCIDETVSMCRATLKGAQDELEIHSPSDKFRKAVGRQITKGVAFGIKEGRGEAKKSAEEMSKETYTAATKWLKKYKKSHKVTLGDEKYFWAQVRNHAQKGTEEYEKITDRLENIQMSQKIAGNFGVSIYTKENGKKVKKKASEYYGEILSAAEKYLDNMKVTHNISLDQEEAYWSKVLKKVKKGSQAWYDARKNLNAVKEEQKDQREERRQAEEERREAAAELKQEKLEYGVSGSGLEAYKAHYKVSAKAEIQYWQMVLAQTTKGSAEYQEAYENLVEARENYNDQMAELNEEYVENCRETNEQLEEDIKELTNAYEEAVKERENEILSATNLFEKFESTGYTKDTLMYNLKTQVAGLALWESDLEKLRAKGFSASVLEQIKAMGPEAAASIHSLTEMSEAEISEYNELWEKKMALAKSQAIKENEALKKETETKINEIKKAAQAQLDTYKKEYEKATTELSKAIEAPLANLARQATTLGEEATLQLIAGIGTQASSNTTKETMKVATQTIASGFDSLPDMGRIIGQNTLDGLLEGLTNKKKINIATGIVANGLLENMERLLDIHSPSRVFRDRIGKMIPAGIGVGIEEGSREAIRPGQKMVQEMMDKMKERIKSQNEALTAYAAKIDTSGLHSLNRILEIPDPEPRTTVNNDITGVIPKILEAIQDLGDKITGIQLVMDTGVVAGELQPHISQESAARTIRRNRGRY